MKYIAFLLLATYSADLSAMQSESKVHAEAKARAAEALSSAILSDFKDKNIDRVALSREGNTIAVANQERISVYGPDNNCIGELSVSQLGAGFVLQDIALGVDGKRLFVLGRDGTTGQARVQICDIHGQGIHRTKSFSCKGIVYADARLLVLDNNNILMYSTNYAELLYIEVEKQTDTKDTNKIHSEFPCNFLPGYTRNGGNSNTNVKIFSVLHPSDTQLHFLHYDYQKSGFYITTMELLRGDYYGCDRLALQGRSGNVFTKSTQLPWFSGYTHATAQLVARPNGSHLYCDGILYDLEGNNISEQKQEHDRFTCSSHGRIVSWPSFAGKRKDPSAPRKGIMAHLRTADKKTLALYAAGAAVALVAVGAGLKWSKKKQVHIKSLRALKGIFAKSLDRKPSLRA